MEIKPKIKIKDGGFLPFGSKSCSFYGNRSEEASVNFEWDNSDPGPEDICFFTDTYIPRVNDYKCRYKIALPLESPPFRQNTYNYLLTHERDFDMIFTFCEKYVKNGNWTWRPHLGSMISPSDMNLYPKTKFCSMIVSEKNETPNHAFRHTLTETAKKWGVDLLGGAFGKPIDKLVGLRDYSFTIVVEASSEPGCVTEQLYDSFATGTIPIYFGADFSHYSAPLSDGWVIRFFNREVLGAILESLGGEAVETSNQLSVIKAFRYAQSLTSVEDWFWKNWPEIFRTSGA